MTMERLDFEKNVKEIIESKLSKLRIKTNVDSNLNIIKIDFNKDDFDIIISNYEKIKKQYFIVNKSFDIVYSNVFKVKKRLLTKFQLQTIKEIEERLKSNISIKPYLSTNLYLSKVSKQDELLKSYDIYHMHLSKPDMKEHFVSRTDKILFFTYDDNNVYFLDVRKHPKGEEWDDVKAIDIKNDMHVLSNDKNIFSNGKNNLLDLVNEIYEDNKDIDDNQIINILKENL